MVSTAHLVLALLFLALAVALTTETSPRWGRAVAFEPKLSGALKRWGHLGAATVLVQSALGGMVRHLDAGLACPDVPLCLGRVVPPLANPLIGLHFAHRLLGALAVFVVIMGTLAVLRAGAGGRLALLAVSGTGLVLAQIGLGVWSVAGRLAVTPVSLHTLVGALLFAVATAQARLGRTADGVEHGALAPQTSRPATFR